jgi:hypothetical protein
VAQPSIPGCRDRAQHAVSGIDSPPMNKSSWWGDAKTSAISWDPVMPMMAMTWTGARPTVRGAQDPPPAFRGPTLRTMPRRERRTGFVPRFPSFSRRRVSRSSSGRLCGGHP